MREQVEQENQHIHDTIAQLKKDLEQYWNQAPVIINGGQLLAGFDSIEEVISARKFETLSRAVPIPRRELCTNLLSGNYRRTLRLIPCPEYVTFTNLRRYVEYLSDPNTQIAIREKFYNHNPIPRVEWDVNTHTILNADAIMPVNYGPEHVSRDVFAVKEWIEIAADLKGSKNKWFGELKLYQDVSANVLTTGDANRFWWPVKIPDTVSTFGIYGLLGEIPSVNNYAYPYTCGRSKVVAHYTAERSYNEIVAMVEM
ncbi:hypothetical protein QE152_g22041 [Popillia japonica]|uniref:Uncharacterized protein n=1 Tax=Popillia japonica TaxID=7064 RepID=A0AAW1KLZ8_POPJA